MVTQANYQEQAIPTHVSAEEYMEIYAEQRYEWVKGELIKLSPVSKTQDRYLNYLRSLLEAYFEINPIGEVIGDGFVMEVETSDSKREPDLMVILNDNVGEFSETKMIGAADICIEIVSPESVRRDYGDKLVDYQRAGVREYWVIDPIHQETRFFRLNAHGQYERYPIEEAEYRSEVLPKFGLHLRLLWNDNLPTISQRIEMVRAMFTADQPTTPDDSSVE